MYVREQVAVALMIMDGKGTGTMNHSILGVIYELNDAWAENSYERTESQKDLIKTYDEYLQKTYTDLEWVVWVSSGLFLNGSASQLNKRLVAFKMSYTAPILTNMGNKIWNLGPDQAGSMLQFQGKIGDWVYDETWDSLTWYYHNTTGKAVHATWKSRSQNFYFHIHLPGNNNKYASGFEAIAGRLPDLAEQPDWWKDLDFNGNWNDTGIFYYVTGDNFVTNYYIDKDPQSQKVLGWKSEEKQLPGHWSKFDSVRNDIMITFCDPYWHWNERDVSWP